MLTNSSPPGRYDEGSAERVCASHVTTVGAAAPLCGTAHAQSCCKTCSKGKACGDSCIAKDKDCKKGTVCACNSYAPHANCHHRFASTHRLRVGHGAAANLQSSLASSRRMLKRRYPQAEQTGRRA